MPAAQDLTQLGQRVAASHGWPAAKAFKSYIWSEQDRAAIVACATDILKMFATIAQEDDLLSATLAFQLQRRLKAPIYLAAGTLRVEGVPVRGDHLPPDGTSPFGTDAHAWRGHLWIMVGPHIVDTTIFRLANRADCPPMLARHIHSTFGPDKGLYADEWRRSKRIGLDYEPLHILTDADMTRLLADAYHLIAQNRP